ncbi:MAG: hypothetical protein A3K65_02410 [Euryarchaeota archaeon RBG_16_68_12]|nr:MAG: hypothetical protein A3K65_02410 [Euryarchaeota archaeon RBG_16_68_12]
MVFENIVAAGISVLALALTVIGGLAYRRARDRSLLVLTTAFAMFFVKGLALTAYLFMGLQDVTILFLIVGGFDVAILVLFYVFTLRR